MADQPSVQEVHYDVPLTNLSLAYMQDPGRFIASQVFKRVPVDKMTDLYWEFPKEYFLRDDMQRRGDATESEGSGWELAKDSYSCEVWALHKDIGSQTAANADPQVAPDMIAAKWLTMQALQRQEAQFVTDFFHTGVWGTDVTGTSDFTQWSDYTGSDPIGDIEDGREAILQATGEEPNTLVIGYRVFRWLKQHPDLIARIQYVMKGQLTVELLAELFEVERVLVAKAIKNTAEEGQPGAYDFHFGKNALLCYSNPNPGIMEHSAAYQFTCTSISGSYGTDVAISRIPVPLKKAERIEIELAWDNKVVGADLAYFFNAAVA